MSRLATSFVLGYHGCDSTIARKAVLDGATLLQSRRDYDWLGPGAYFWESDPTRAFEWAQWKTERGEYREPAVIGAVIDLGNCLDLVSREDIELFRAAYNSFERVQKKSGLPLPKNASPKGARDKDRLLRFLDCAVFRHLHRIIDDLHQNDPTIEPFDTVRGMFVEGGKAFSGSGIYTKEPCADRRAQPILHQRYLLPTKFKLRHYRRHVLILAAQAAAMTRLRPAFLAA